MPMLDYVREALSQDTQPDDVGQLRTKLSELVKLSRSQMSSYYDNFDRNDRVFRGEKVPDEEDKKAALRKAPQKFVMPVSFAQIDTFRSFVLAVLNDRDYFYELGGSGIEDEQAAKIGQLVLEQNLEHNNFRYQKLKQFATDVAKYGLGVFKHSWRKETKTIFTMQPKPVQVPAGMEAPPVEMVKVPQEATKYLGNEVVVISPYRFFPDPRVPLTRFAEGEFCASEDEYSRTQMAAMEREGTYAGTKFIPELAQDAMENRRRFSFEKQDLVQMNRVAKPYVILTEVQVYLNPSEVMIGGKKLGDEDYNCLYIAAIANDTRLVRLEKLEYPHQTFTYDVAQFDEDQINFINGSMADLIGPMQDVIDWLINSRITNVRKVIGNQLVVDPKGIEIQDIRDRKPVLRLKPAVQGMGVDKWVKQLPLADVTQGHINDVNFLDAFVKQTTGITENLMGMFASGRRSAQEARNVNNNATARIMMIVHAMWNSALLPLGRKMLDNLRAGLDEPTMVRVLGDMNTLLNIQGVQHFMKVSPEQLLGDYDFLLFDGALPSQKAAQAQTLQELLAVTMSSPEAAFMFGYDPQSLMAKILELRGIRNAEQYKLTPDKARQLITLVQAGRNAMAPQSTSGDGQPSQQPGNQQRPAK